MHAVVSMLNSKHFHPNASFFQITVQLQLHCSYITVVYCEKLQKKRLSFSEKYRFLK